MKLPLLVAWSDGDTSARDELMPLVYEELRRLAHRYMGRERTGHTLQTSGFGCGVAGRKRCR